MKKPEGTNALVIATAGALSVTFVCSDQPLQAQLNLVQQEGFKECVVIDNDYDIDDMQAIPLVIGNKNVRVIIQTEGATLPEQAAPALEALVNSGDRNQKQQSIPILVGGRPATSPNLKRWPWLPFFRSMMGLSNGLLTSQPKPWSVNTKYPQQVANELRECKKISMLITGPFSSFIHYGPLVKDKVKRVVVSGRALSERSGNYVSGSFNCTYDMKSCRQAMPLLKVFHAEFVDIPNFPDCLNRKSPVTHCYTPSLAMVAGEKNSSGDLKGGLLQIGLPGRLRQALINPIACSRFYPQAIKDRPCSSRSTWEPSQVKQGPGGSDLLWDQSAALMFVNPSAFTLFNPQSPNDHRGSHYEPSLVNGSHSKTVESLRLMWTNLTNNAAITR